jgi:hypothetical protein
MTDVFCEGASFTIQFLNDDGIEEDRRLPNHRASLLNQFDFDIGVRYEGRQRHKGIALVPQAPDD